MSASLVMTWEAPIASRHESRKLFIDGFRCFLDDLLCQRLCRFLVGSQVEQAAEKESADQRNFGISQPSRHAGVGVGAHAAFSQVDQDKHRRPLQRIDVALEYAA